ncbi:STAS domain-containing protein [Streptomyces sp. BE303]|uniref:STAS domain-containing protein n=1 Tax=Streptomyces sp. BE303 TaxID=3002528 RepID=UPI002E759E20|nr:STAS domain-containing protein [Streptomyces sp. BE303]
MRRDTSTAPVPTGRSGPGPRFRFPAGLGAGRLRSRCCEERRGTAQWGGASVGRVQEKAAVESGLRITRRQTAPGVRQVALDGYADMDTAAVLRAALEDEFGATPLPTTLVVDCGELSFCASAGLNELLRGRLTAAGLGVTFQVASPRDQLRRLLHLTETSALLGVRPATESTPS